MLLLDSMPPVHFALKVPPEILLPVTPLVDTSRSTWTFRGSITRRLCVVDPQLHMSIFANLPFQDPGIPFWTATLRDNSKVVWFER